MGRGIDLLQSFHAIFLISTNAYSTSYEMRQQRERFRAAILTLLTLIAVSVPMHAEDEPSLTVTSPNGGESWCVGSVQTITWESVGISKVDIFISGDDGANFNYLSTGVSGNSYQWLIPENQPAGILYRIRIQESGGSIADTGARFTINTKPEIRSEPGNIIAPVWSTVSFIATAGGTPKPDVEWEVSTDNGTSWNRVTGNTAVGVLTEKLTLYYIDPDLDDNLYRAVFTNACASLPTAPARLSVVSVHLNEPNGGEVICAGESQMISWSMRGIHSTPTYLLSYTSDAGETWNSIATVVQDTSYLWTTPRTQVATPRYWVRVTTSSVITTDTSDATFTVNAGPSMALDPKDTSGEAGRLLPFTAAAYGRPEPTAQWQVSTDGGSSWITFNISKDSLTDGRTDSRLVVPALVTSKEGDLYRVIFTNACGSDTSATARLQVTEPQTDVPDSPDGAERPTISVIPNPVGRRATLEARLPRTGNVRITVTDMNGRTVVTSNHGTMEHGTHSIPIDCTSLPDGAYTCTLDLDGRRSTTKLTIVR